MDRELRPHIHLSDVPPDFATLYDDWISRFSSRTGHLFVRSLTRYDQAPSGVVQWAADVNGGVQECVSIFTDHNEYRITARYNCQRTYLGCISCSRKPRAGESHFRGSDLVDGPFTYETWFRILADIVSYELVQVAKSQRPIAEGMPFPSAEPSIQNAAMA